jgi:ribonuclease BN (tRNA processing enzyme)
MRLTVMGSGDASNGAGRGHSCYWLDAPGAGSLMVDVGGSGLMAIRRFGRSPLELGGLVFTHLHGDHMGGFPFLFIDAVYGEVRREPLAILGPLGVEARLGEALEVAYRGLLDKPTPFSTSWGELLPGHEVEHLGWRIAGFPAEHQDPPEQPLCLRVTAPDGAAVAFSGDTKPCQGLVDAAAGVDLLVAECTHLAQPAGKHTTWEDWTAGGLLERVSARKVLLTHLSTSVREAVPRLEADVADERVAFADDGQRWGIPLGAIPELEHEG